MRMRNRQPGAAAVRRLFEEVYRTERNEAVNHRSRSTAMPEFPAGF